MAVAGWATLALLLLALVPLFLCMPVTVDVAFYDICARHLLRGEAPERDFLLLQPPGMMWSLALVRFILGWRSEAVRLADLFIVGGNVGLLVHWLGHAGLSRLARVWVSAGLLAFYLTASEWVHCQPDTWMLLPALIALHLRRRQTTASGIITTVSGQIGRAFMEGLCWGAACLVKPFVVFPGVATWVVSAVIVRRSGAGWLRRLGCDAAGLLLGGLLMGAVWQGSLVARGTFHDYWHNYALFAGEYYSQSAGLADRLRNTFLLLPPWALLHAVAVPLALLAVVWAVLRPVISPPTLAMPLLAAFYLGWLVQANLVQTQFNYHLVPPILLG